MTTIVRVGAAALVLVLGVMSVIGYASEETKNQAKAMVNKQIPFFLSNGKSGTATIKAADATSNIRIELTMNFAMTDDAGKNAPGRKILLTKHTLSNAKLWLVTTMVEPIVQLLGGERDDYIPIINGITMIAAAACLGS